VCVCMCKKERKILPFAKTWMKLEGVELSETHQIDFKFYEDMNLSYLTLHPQIPAQHL